MLNNRIRFLKIPIDIVSHEDLEEKIKDLSENGKKNQIILVTLFDILKAKFNKDLLNTINSSNLILPVSNSIIIGAKFLKLRVPVRYMPFDFVIKVLGILEKLRKSVYLLGSKQYRLQISASNLRTSFPELRQVGRCAGYYNEKSKDNILTAVKKASPGMILAGKGLKGKNVWYINNKKDLNPGIFLWAGDIYDIFSGKKKRPSRALFNKSLDFLPRLARNPLRIFRIFVYIYYIIILLIYKIFKL